MIVLADPNPELTERIGGVLGRGDELIQVASITEMELILAERSAEIEVVILGPALETQEALEAAAGLQVRAPEVSVMLISGQDSSDILHAALRSGVKDVLPESFEEPQLKEAVTRAEGLARQLRGRIPKVSDPPRQRANRVITVFSSKGGSGKSFLALNLAVLLARDDHEVGLIDLDLQSGDLAIMLQVMPAWTIYDAAENYERLDIEALRGYLTPHRSGISLLAAPLEPSLAEAVSGDAVHRILQILREHFSYVVVDGPAFFTDQVLAALDESDQCVLIASMDVPSIKNLRLALQTLEQLGVPREKIRLVLNRANSNVGLRVSEVEKTLGRGIDVSLPSSREVPLSINRGIPLAMEKKSQVIGAIAELAETLRLPADARGSPRTGLFRRG